MKILAFCLIFVISTHLNAATITYLYVDGSGNRFLIIGDSRKTIKYVPVSAEQSSSGTYSGGEAVVKIINEREYSTLMDYYKKAMGNKKIRIPNRIKGSGYISTQSATDSQQKGYILNGSASEKKELEAYLFFLIGRVQ
ncbi:hypothetical protein [Leptospira sp. 'Mane']|uniref:hypothetical protein n=1 Tax=Leptospira sp. 'Mane' TaxID=3387407 RepID=UPI00398AD38D